MQICPSRARDCEFSAWNDWAACTQTCGDGHQHRSRVIIVAATAGGIDCDGFLQEFQRCAGVPCPGKPEIDCQWGPWSHMSDCSALCNGHSERNRAIMQFAADGGQACDGAERDIQGCNLDAEACLKDMPLDCVMGEWADWTLCSKPCDGGQQYRSRQIKSPAKNFGDPCKGSMQLSRPCGTALCPGDTKIDCKWGDWGGWSACSKTCLGGQRVRHREIEVEPSPDGLPCQKGPAMQTVPCSTGPCKHLSETCGWGPWSLWGPCSKDCGSGQQERFRQQAWVHNTPSLSSGRRLLVGFRNGDSGDCDGSQKEIRPCGIAPCNTADSPVPCRWEAWSDWTGCSCNGIRERSRNIGSPPQNGGLFCTGPSTSNEKCTPQNCGWSSSIDCSFGQWAGWSECDATCGGGQRYHTRSIAKHSESYGFACNGGLEEVGDCNTQACGVPVDCQYGPWSPWTMCTQTCGGGEHTRSRSIQIAASNGGAPCDSAPLLQMGECATDACEDAAVKDCTWTTWQPWHPCSVTCSNGTTFRKRNVAMQPANGGVPCDGYFEQYHGCNMMACVQEVADCQFADWSPWSSCTSRCGGQQERSRNIAVYARGMGKACQGPSRQLKPCDGAGSAACQNEIGPHDCALSDWSQWNACAATCGGGQQYATRRVTVAAVGGGQACAENSLKKVRPCNDQPCPGDEPVDCMWADWGSLSRCSATCGGGQRYRHRTVLSHPKNGGTPCGESDTLQVIPCATGPCDQGSVCMWTAWSFWGSCSAACDGGDQQRHRTYINPSQLYQDDGKSDIAGEWGLLRGAGPGAASGRLASIASGAPAMLMQLCALIVVGAAVVAVSAWAPWRRVGIGEARQHIDRFTVQASYAPVPSHDPLTDALAE